MLRTYQKEIVTKVLSIGDNALIQADTGAGKTKILATIAKASKNVLLIAHRNNLVSQLSFEFAAEKLYHSMICSKHTRRRAVFLQRKKIGKCYHSLKSNKYVCSVDTLISKQKRGELNLDVDKEWTIIIDEAHHVIDDNKWGEFCKIFNKSRIIGATATPCRLDGVLLKKGKGGVFDRLVQAEELKKDSITKLIKKGFISPFKCYGVDSKIDDKNLKIGKNDYTNKSLLSEFNAHITELSGDAIRHYKKLARDKQAVAFCASIKIAELTAKSFRKSGVASACIHSKMSRSEVDKVFDLFEQKEIKVLCNVDMTGEGVDIPAIECLILLNKTASIGRYRQWVGRSLRPCVGKDYSIIIDHADNIKSHGLPDDHIEWDLNKKIESKKSNLISCGSCGFLFKAWEMKCPECGTLTHSKGGFSTKEVKYIDINLVEIHRTKKAKDSRDKEFASDVSQDEIRYLKKIGTKVNETETKIAIWFYKNIKHKVTRVQIEDFLFRKNNMQFWSSHFTLADLRKSNEKKCWKVFNEFKRN